MHACLHTFLLGRQDVHFCFSHLACMCMCVCVCMFLGEHCLLETLSKSPQCDNWLPGVPVSLLLIIVIP